MTEASSISTLDSTESLNGILESSKQVCQEEESEVKHECSTYEMFAEELEIIKRFPTPSSEEIEKRKVALGKKNHKFSLILDLDCTLIYSSPINSENSSFALKIRPYARQLLKEISEYYEIIIFSAAEANYVQTIVNVLDKERKYVSGILTREHCICIGDEYYIKDLRIIADRKLDEMLIVDDNIFSFAFQIGNGIPVTEYGGDAEDKELSHLISYLITMSKETELVEANRKNIGLVA